MSLKVLDPATHRDLRLKKKSDFRFVRKQMIVPVWGQEIPRAALHFPVLFMRREGFWIPVVLLGLSEGENRFVSEKGEWLAEFLPAALMAHPFYSVNSAEGKPVLAVEEDDPALTSEDSLTEESWPLFDDSGSPTDITKKALMVLEQIRAQQEFTWSVMDAIEAVGLLKPWRPSQGGNGQASGELFAIDESMIDELKDVDFLSIRGKSVLALMYSHLFSLKHLQLRDRKRSTLWLSASQKGVSPLFSQEQDLFIFGDD